MPPVALTSHRPGPGMAPARRTLAVVAAAIVVALGAFSAQAALLLLAPGRPAPPAVSRVVPPPAVRTLLPSPARGATGTAPLPPEPPRGLPFPSPAEEGSAVAALPFSLRGIGAADRGRAVECLAAAIYYEAASEPVDGQRAVAQVVLNRVRHAAFPPTVCGVVYQGSERAGCQFSFACDGAMARAPARDGWARATRIAAAALAGTVYAPVGLATHYHTYAVTPAWNRSLVMTDAVGAHFFHRWRGYWGTSAAFARRYRGHEPVPGPHPAATAARVAAVVAEEGAVPAVAIVPPRAAASIARPAPLPLSLSLSLSSPLPATAPTSPEAQILERWRDSGRPLTRN
ncbi:MAG: cell wall hydrolase [Sphingomonas adhaesiva]